MFRNVEHFLNFEVMMKKIADFQHYFSITLFRNIGKAFRACR